MQKAFTEALSAMFVSAILITAAWWFVDFVKEIAKTKRMRILMASAMIGVFAFAYYANEWWDLTHRHPIPPRTYTPAATSQER